MNIPAWWAVVLLVNAVFRLTRLVGWDDLTIRPRRWVCGVGDEQHHQWAHVIDTLHNIDIDVWRDMPIVPPPFSSWSMLTTRRNWLETRMSDATGSEVLPPLVLRSDCAPPVGRERYYLSKLIHCPWCAGFWIAVVWWLVWLAWPHATVALSVPLALSAIVGMLAKNLDE